MGCWWQKCHQGGYNLSKIYFMTLGGHSLRFYWMMMACCHHRSFPYCKCKKDTKAVFNAAVCFLHIDLTWFRGSTLGAWNSSGEPLQNQGLQMVFWKTFWGPYDWNGLGLGLGRRQVPRLQEVPSTLNIGWLVLQALFWTLEFQIKFTAVGTTCPGRNAVCKWDSDIENGWPVENIPEYVPVWLMGSSKLNGSNIALKLPGWPAQCHLELNPSFIRPHEIGDGPKGRNTLVAYII